MSKLTEKPGLQFPIHFEDTSIAFQHKSDRDLLLSYMIFLLTKRPFLVKFLSKAAKLSLSMGLPVKPIIKATVFRQFCGGETPREYQKVIQQLSRARIGAILDYSVEGGGDEAGFEETKNAILETIQQAESQENIPFACMKMTGIGAESLLEKMTAKKTLSKEDLLARERLKGRLAAICKQAGKGGTPIYIDAEESWIQGAIDDLTEEMMQAFNQKSTIVFTTLQLYRTDRVDYFKRLIEKARRDAFRLGIKLYVGPIWSRNVSGPGISAIHHRFIRTSRQPTRPLMKPCVCSWTILTMWRFVSGLTMRPVVSCWRTSWQRGAFPTTTRMFIFHSFTA
jgi:proline dehydrogenase